MHTECINGNFAKWTHEKEILCFPDANDISHSKNGCELKELNKQMETEYEKLQQRAENNVEIIIKKTLQLYYTHIQIHLNCSIFLWWSS